LSFLVLDPDTEVSRNPKTDPNGTLLASHQDDAFGYSHSGHREGPIAPPGITESPHDVSGAISKGVGV